MNDEEQFLASPNDLATITGKTADDPKLILELRRATSRFTGDVGRTLFLVKADTVALNGGGGQTLILPAFPVANVSVSVGGVAVTDFQVDEDAGILRRQAGWPDGLGNIQVTFDHGFEEIPGDVADAVLERAQIALTSNPAIQQRTLGISGVTFGQQATTGVTQAWSDAVNRYRR
jgi:hypothetical protein